MDIQILKLLQNYPLDSFSSLAKKLNVSHQTIIRKINRLQENNILRNSISSLIPESLSLIRFHILFNVKSIEQLTYLQLAFIEHPYTRYYSRFYGERFGILAFFDIPPGSENYLMQFFDYLVEKEYCSNYIPLKALGYRISYPAPFPNYRLNPKNFNLVNYWNSRLEQPTDLPPLPKPIDAQKITPIQLFILLQVTRNARITQTEIIKTMRDVAFDPEKRKSYQLSETIINYLVDYFNSKSEYAIKMDVSRQFQFVLKNFITGPRWNINRKLFDSYITRGYLIKDIPLEQSAQLYLLLKNNRPPFRIGFDILQEGIFINIALPPYYDAKFSYLIWTSFSNYQLYSLDYYGKHGLFFPFYIENYDLEKKQWRSDKEWMYSSVIATFEDKLQNGIFDPNKIFNGNNGIVTT